MRRVRLIGVGVLALALVGCGGGGGTPATGGGGSNPLDQGRTALNSLASGQQSADAQTLQGVLDLFNQAVQSAPNSSEAHFGAAVALAGVVAQEVEASPGIDAPPPPPPVGGSGGSGGSPGLMPPGELPPTPPGYTGPVQPVTPAPQLGLFWNLGSGLSNPLALLHALSPITDIRFGLIPYYGYRGDDAASRQKMLDSLNAVVEHLAKVEADPNFSFTLPVPVPTNPPSVVPAGQGKGTGRAGAQTVTVGLSEVYLFDAYVNSLRVEVALSLAYVHSTGDWRSFLPPVVGSATGGVSSSASASSLSSPKDLDTNHDGKLTPNEYLPPSPFLTLRDAAYFKTAQQALQAVADKAAKGIDGVLARPESGSFLIPNTAAMRQALTDTRDKALPLIRQAATGPVTFDLPQVQPLLLPMPGNDMPPPAPAHTETITLNLAAWFANPPADLKRFAPTLTLGPNGWPQPGADAYPDPTFGGLFPKGLPKDLLF